MSGIAQTAPHLLWPDYLKITAFFAVILIHSASPLVEQYGDVRISWWWAGNIYDSAARWCIPVFFMLSGMFLIQESNKESWGLFYRKRLYRAIVPLLLWSIAYCGWRIHVNGEDIRWTSCIISLLKKPAYYHLWFMYVLLQLYAITPLLATFMQHTKKRALVFFFVAWFIVGSWLPTLYVCCSFHPDLTFGGANSVMSYIGYYILGFVLRDKYTGIKRRLLAVSIAWIGFCVTAYGTYWQAWLHDGIHKEVFYAYYAPNVLVMSTAVYMFAKSFDSMQRTLPKTNSGGLIVRTVAACVPGMYFVHAMVLASVKRGYFGFSFSETSVHPFLAIPLLASAIFFHIVACGFYSQTPSSYEIVCTVNYYEKNAGMVFFTYCCPGIGY